MNKNKVFYFFAGALFILGLSIGFLAGKSYPQSSQQTIKEIEPDTATPNNLYNAQTATIWGQIINKNGNKLTVKNLKNQVEGNIEVSDRIIISKAGQSSRAATSSSDLSGLELNKETLITLEMTEGKYQAISIQYLAPAPSLPPVPKN